MTGTFIAIGAEKVYLIIINLIKPGDNLKKLLKQNSPYTLEVSNFVDYLGVIQILKYGTPGFIETVLTTFCPERKMLY